jgi:hypothetical protein
VRLLWVLAACWRGSSRNQRICVEIKTEMEVPEAAKEKENEEGNAKAATENKMN